MTLRLSLNCREAQDEDRPLDAHVCTGCGCGCHLARVPLGALKAAVQAAKAGEDIVIPLQREGA
jgi:hypothetical protein